jgi:tetratricopeptide (TPR) repeat protein
MKLLLEFIRLFKVRCRGARLAPWKQKEVNINAQGFIWQKILLVYLLSISSLVFIPEQVIAQMQPANSLMVDRDEPLIPDSYGKRELTSFEKYRIERVIVKLNQTAQAELEKDNQDKAFKLWYRQLRLSRVLSIETEIKALGEIGAIAWSENRSTDVRNLANRLTEIQGEITTTKKFTPELLDKLARAYQQVRYLDQAVNIYRQILTNSRKSNDLIAQEKNLQTLGQLYLARFDYQKAADIYQQLLTLSNQKPVEQNQVNIYLVTLSDIYQRTEQIDKAIATRKRLIQKYNAAQKANKIPALEIAIARDYETLKQLEQAIKVYNNTFEIAFQTQQLAIASEALTRLGKLYQQSEQINLAISTYNKLLQVQQQTYNYYGLINTYDILGKIHLNLNQKSQAKQYFQQGLEIAKSLNYQVEYFNNQIHKLT